MKNLIIIFILLSSNILFANEAYYIQSQSKLNFQDIKGMSFYQPLPKKSLGYNNDYVWVMLKLDAIKENNILEINYPLDTINLYATDLNGKELLMSSSEHTKNHSRSHIFETSSIDKNYPVYLEVKSKTTLLIPLKHSNFENYLRGTSISQFTLGSFYGILFVAILFGLILLITTREKLYFYITLFLSSYLMFQLSLNKEFPILFGSVTDFWLFDSIPLFGGLTFLFLTLFIKELFNYKYKFIRISYWICGILCLISSTSWIYLPYNFSVQICMAAIGVCSIILTAATLWILSKEKVSTQALTYSLSWIPFYLLINSITLKTLGIIPSNFFTNYGLQFASLIGVFAIYHRIYKNYLSSIQTEQHHKLLKNKEKIFSEVRHDIRSPLTSLNFVINSINTKLSDDEKLLSKQSLERINDIISTLNHKSVIDETAITTNEILFPLIHRIVAEKRNELRKSSSINISIINKLDFGVFCKLNKSTFSRAISNILNNAIESNNKIENELQINLILSNNSELVFIDIKDNGVGIPKENLELIFREGFSFNKSQGSGLGLSIAKKYIESIGGLISVNSTISSGTTFSIVLKKSEPESWFCQEIGLNKSNICIVDDDKSIHTTWRQIFLKHAIHPKCFSNANSFRQWASNTDTETFNYLFDFDLSNSTSNGIDLIREYKLSKYSTLVTSHYNEKSIQEVATQLGIKILPKELVAYVPIRTNTSLEEKQFFDAILIDDDSLIHTTWNLHAKNNNIKLRSFYTINQFLEVARLFDNNTKIFLDSNLGNSIKGEIEGKKIFDLGFKNIYIQSGLELKNLPTWIIASINKCDFSYLN